MHNCLFPRHTSQPGIQIFDSVVKTSQSKESVLNAIAQNFSPGYLGRFGLHFPSTLYFRGPLSIQLHIELLSTQIEVAPGGCMSH